MDKKYGNALVFIQFLYIFTELKKIKIKKGPGLFFYRATSQSKHIKIFKKF